MKVLFTGLFPIWQCHFTAECNFIEEHLAAGDSVTVLACDAMLRACDANSQHSLSHCLACMGLREDLLGMLSADVKKLPLISNAARMPKSIPHFKTIDKLKKFSWNDTPTGADILSSLITATGSTAPNLVAHRKLVKDYITDYVQVYSTALDYLDKYQFEKVYIFNGRFASARAWIRACKARSVTFVTQERLGSPERVTKVTNDGIHNPAAYTRRMREFWDTNKNIPEIIATARDFFEERPKGQLTGWYSFVKDQNPEQLPDNWDTKKQNIAIFASTEIEFIGLPEYFSSGPFPDQRRAYSDLAQAFLPEIDRTHFYLRIHPNSKNDVMRWWDDPIWDQLPNITIIPPESTVSSYTLMQACEKTVVWITTMGAEATYWGNPSIILGNAFYGGLDAVYEPQSLQEAVNLIKDRDLPAKNRDNVLAYSAFLRCGLPKLPYSEAISSCKLTFKGRQPNAHPAILRSLWNWENIVSKAPVPSWIKHLWQKWEWYRLRSRISVK